MKRLILLSALLTVSLNVPGFAASVSDETPPSSCGNGLVAGISCAGSYCDNIKPICGPTGLHLIQDIEWTRFVSEEGTGASCSVVNSNSKDGSGQPGFITGFACRGKYCDEIALECVGLADAFPSSSGCRWTHWVSEETPALRFPQRYAATQMQCKGRYCDNKRFFICPIRARGNANPGALRMADLRINLSGFSSSSECEGDKPPDIGCTTLCKPCVTWVCEDGDWVRLDLTMSGDPMCTGSNAPGGSDPAACPRRGTFCPAECSYCF